MTFAQRINDVHLALKQIINILSRPTWMDPTTGRVNINSITTLPTLGTVTTVTNSTNWGSPAQNIYYTQLFSNEKINWAQNVRSRIS